MKVTAEARRYIIDNLISVGCCFGINGRAADFVNKVMPNVVDVDDVARHYDRFCDWNINRLFYSEMDILNVSDELFLKFCEEYLNPVYNRRERVQNEDYELEYIDHTSQCEKIINEGLSTVGLEVACTVNENGLRNYKVRNKVQYPSEPIKNIIFAANQTKPDIVIDNALENNVKILDVGDALVYSDGIPEDGITWLGLTKWFEQFEADETQKALVRKLESSLDSKPEKLFFKTYIEYIVKN